MKKIKIKRLIEALEKLDPEGILYCLDPEHNHAYGFDGLPHEMGPRIYRYQLKDQKNSIKYPFLLFFLFILGNSILKFEL